MGSDTQRDVASKAGRGASLQEWSKTTLFTRKQPLRAIPPSLHPSRIDCKAAYAANTALFAAVLSNARGRETAALGPRNGWTEIGGADGRAGGESGAADDAPTQDGTVRKPLIADVGVVLEMLDGQDVTMELMRADGRMRVAGNAVKMLVAELEVRSSDEGRAGEGAATCGRVMAAPTTVRVKAAELREDAGPFPIMPPLWRCPRWPGRRRRLSRCRTTVVAPAQAPRPFARRPSGFVLGLGLPAGNAGGNGMKTEVEEAE
uniref:Uncharacterized protein n=1 Tax=Mycena chlorophos TaxID=658473 RepID=A0ABQ0LP04_MYCCL|nr:predicted protein [Mycena chlorophos]